MTETSFYQSSAWNTSGRETWALVQELLFLIKRLHSTSDPPSPNEIQEIEAKIQRLQREPSGWSVGLDLLTNEQPIIRFYGALTLTVKINADWDSDNFANDKNLREQLQGQLVRRYAVLTNAPDVAFVLRKLCSTLAACFAQPTTDWQFPVRDVLVSIFGHGTQEQLQHIVECGTSDFNSLIPSMKTITYDQLRAILWLSLSLVEDGLRNEPRGIAAARLITRIVANGDDVWRLLCFTLQSFHMRMGVLGTTHPIGVDIGASIHDEQLIELTKDLAMPTALAWMKLTPPDKFAANSMTVEHIGRAVALIAQSFQFPVMAKTVVEVLTAMKQAAPQYYKQVDPSVVDSILKSKQAETWVVTLRNGDFNSDAMHYPEFLVSLVESEDLSSPDYFVNHKLDSVIPVLHLLLQCDGPAVVEDLACSMALEVFSQIAEGFADWTGEHAGDDSMKSLLAAVCRSCYSKVQYPSEEIDESTQTWDASDRSKFKDFRRDVEDFFLSSFSALGPALLADTANLITNDTTNSWESFEAGLFCLGTLSESMANETALYDSVVSSVFRTARWIGTVQNTTQVPSRVRHGAINFISRSTAYLQRHREQLIPCLNFLFSSLPLQSSTSAASRAINALCTTHRSILISSLPQFIAALTQLPPVSSMDKQRLFGAVAAIIQAAPGEDKKLQPLSEILDILFHDFQTLVILASSNEEEKLTNALDLVQCLAAIGKGLRAPADVAIDLDSEDDQFSQYWKTGPGTSVQVAAIGLLQRTLNLLQFRFSDEIVAAACDFLRAGYTEQDPSPFKFEPEVSVEFFNSTVDLSTPNLNVVMASASAFLASALPDSLDTAFPTIIATVIDAQRTLLSTFAATKQYADHDFTYSSIDFFVRLLPKWGGRLFSIPDFGEPLQVVFDFALAALENPDTLPRRSSTSFWSAIFDLSGYPAVAALPASASSTLLAFVQQYSARFIAALVRLLGGECARSELDALSEPLRKFVSKQTQLARGLLREAVKEDAGVLPDRALAAVDLPGRMRFVAQVEALRGGRKTNEAVKEFWIACRGSAFGYTI